jgi:hypothetical protein
LPHLGLLLVFRLRLWAVGDLKLGGKLTVEDVRTVF